MLAGERAGPRHGVDSSALIWGPGDNHLHAPNHRACDSGRLRRIGRGDPLVDPIYIDNAAEAHLLAGDRLDPAHR